MLIPGIPFFWLDSNKKSFLFLQTFCIAHYSSRHHRQKETVIKSNEPFFPPLPYPCSLPSLTLPLSILIKFLIFFYFKESGVNYDARSQMDLVRLLSECIFIWSKWLSGDKTTLIIFNELQREGIVFPRELRFF